MEVKSISKDLKNKILVLAKDLDYDKRVLFILKNLGPQRFTELENFCDISRSTLSKYLKLLNERSYIMKKIHDDNKPRYFITERGVEKINQESREKEEGVYLIDKLNKNISRLSELISFYEEIGVEESIIFQIVRKISKTGESFFHIEQNRELYLALFYIFFNSVLTRDYKFEINAFCKHYNVKKLRIDFYVDKIMSSKLGFYMFTRERGKPKHDYEVDVEDDVEDDIFFFHEEDIVGTTTLRLINDRIIDEIIHINKKGYRKIYDLDKMAEEIAEKLIKMDLIWNRIREIFEMLIEKLIIKGAINMGFSKTFLMDIVIQSEKTLKSRGGVKSLINIIEGSERYEDLNIVSITQTKESSLDDILVQIQGFCHQCGKIILDRDLSNVCSKCGVNFKPKELLKSIDAANEVSMNFKEKILQEEELVKCPNPKCNYHVKSSWKQCPECQTLL